MTTINVSREKLDCILADVEHLIEDVSALLDQDEIAKKRMAEIQTNPSIGKSEKELDEYLKQRGVNVE
jgi:hypothetical protein